MEPKIRKTREELEVDIHLSATPQGYEDPKLRGARKAKRRKTRFALRALDREMELSTQSLDDPSQVLSTQSVDDTSQVQELIASEHDQAWVTMNGIDLEESKQEDDDPDFVLGRRIARDEMNDLHRRLDAVAPSETTGRPLSLSRKGKKGKKKQRKRNRRLPLTNEESADDRGVLLDMEEDEDQEDNREDDEEQGVTEQERRKIYRRSVRHGHALNNHETFKVSSVSGKDLSEARRHRLPAREPCTWCGTLKWPGESKTICCLKGVVSLPPLSPAPARLLQLYGDPDFRQRIRPYNQVMAFTSIGATRSDGAGVGPVREDHSVQGQRGVYTYRIQGAMGHYLGSLLPHVDRTTGQPSDPKFAQIYVVDPDMRSRAVRRRGIFADLDPVVLLDLEDMMQQFNPFAQQFLSYGEKLRADVANGKQVVDIVYTLHAEPSRPGTHNLPTVSEVGATLIDDGNLDKPRDILLYARDHSLLRLFETFSSYDPLQYPLLFPHGELGWTYTDKYADNQRRAGKSTMSLREHVAYRLFPKPGDGSVLHLGGRLFQQWVVDQQAKIEQGRLRWVAENQNKLRAEVFSGVVDALAGEDTSTLREGEAVVSEYNRTSAALENPRNESGSARTRGHFLDQIGRRVILPATHTGSPRYMYKPYQDAMAMVREYGKPDIFLTMTCNPEWEEIVDSIPEHLTAQDRPDIVGRVWDQKLRALLKDLDEGVIGRMVARVYVVEFQKRGLPHAHILVILAEEDKPRSRELIDKLVSAEIPDEDANPLLYETVLTCMLHGICGDANPHAPCMKDGKCSKGFPKPLADVTRADEDAYPLYMRRRRTRRKLKFKNKTYDNETLNQWVVPYNPWLLFKYNCHMNLEVCTSISAVKYLFKYVYKGPDRALITVEAVPTARQRNGEAAGDNAAEENRGDRENERNPNEILQYLNARYISPMEAVLDIINATLHDKSCCVTTLDVHLPGGQTARWRPGTNPAEVVRRTSRTMLTAAFELWASDRPEHQVAKRLKYQDFPKKFRWDNKGKEWVLRLRRLDTIGRMVHVSPREHERYYLRVMLSNRAGATSFEDLRTVRGTVYPTYKDAAMHAGYLEHDGEWVACMEEASFFQMPYQLRQLFATMLVYSMPTDVRALWDRFYPELSRDYVYRYRSMVGEARENMIKFQTLKSLQELLEGSGSGVHNFDLPQFSEFGDLLRASLLENSFIRNELEGYDHTVLQDIVSREGQLNTGQREIYDQIIEAVGGAPHAKKLFFIDGPGGTGKSTLLHHILAKVRLSGKLAVAVASSGIAALLLMGGRTAHSTFKIPLNLEATSTCLVTKQSALAGFLKEVSLIIWDEAPMTHRFAFEAVDRMLRDIMDNEEEPFGGKTFVLAGDFRQTLPVVVQGTPAQTIDACIKSSELWRHFTTVRLTENMRVMAAGTTSNSTELAAFANYLLEVGEGRHQVDPSLGSEFMKIPSDMLIASPETEVSDEDDGFAPGAISRGLRRMIDAMYADINNPAIATDEYFAGRMILTTTNKVVHRINEAVANRLEAVAHEYLSADSVEDDDNGMFEPEILHTLNLPGTPPHKLVLKKGSPIMMMRNLNPNLGLCNGTRLRVVDLKPHVIHATIMTGERQGQHVLIPRIIFISGETVRDYPFRLRRKQFPVQPAYAMTINKAQGQTVSNLGLYLSTPCFSHGQLYVALSRVTSRSKFKALIEYPEKEDDDGIYTKNIVYRQILQNP